MFHGFSHHPPTIGALRNWIGWFIYWGSFHRIIYRIYCWYIIDILWFIYIYILLIYYGFGYILWHPADFLSVMVYILGLPHSRCWTIKCRTDTFTQVVKDMLLSSSAEIKLKPVDRNLQMQKKHVRKISVIPVPWFLHRVTFSVKHRVTSPTSAEVRWTRPCCEPSWPRQDQRPSFAASAWAKSGKAWQEI